MRNILIIIAFFSGFFIGRKSIESKLIKANNNTLKLLDETKAEQERISKELEAKNKLEIEKNIVSKEINNRKLFEESNKLFKNINESINNN